jgi:hypothetical protein
LLFGVESAALGVERRQPPPGVYGLLVGLAILVAIWLLTYYTRGAGRFNLDPKGIPGTFDPILAKYLRVSEFIVGLAAGSIVPLIGSSALRVVGYAWLTFMVTRPPR